MLSCQKRRQTQQEVIDDEIDRQKDIYIDVLLQADPLLSISVYGGGAGESCRIWR